MSGIDEELAALDVEIAGFEQKIRDQDSRNRKLRQWM